jgi:plasmid stability protein
VTTLRVSLDDETYSALMADAGRHVRPTHWHIKVILRQALGLEFPLPQASVEVGDVGEVHAN